MIWLAWMDERKYSFFTLCGVCFMVGYLARYFTTG